MGHQLVTFLLTLVPFVLPRSRIATPPLLAGRRYGIFVDVILEGLLNPLGGGGIQFTTR